MTMMTTTPQKQRVAPALGFRLLVLGAISTTIWGTFALSRMTSSGSSSMSIDCGTGVPHDLTSSSSVLSAAATTGIQMDHAKQANTHAVASASSMSLADFESLTARLLGPDTHASGCPSDGCGCPKKCRLGNNAKCAAQELDVDCPKWFSIYDLQQASSGSSSSFYSTEVTKFMDDRLQERQQASSGECDGRKKATSKSGGWCLKPLKYEAYSYPKQVFLSRGHIRSDPGICSTLSDLLTTRTASSVSDFGAGVGQYGACLLSANHNLTVHSYDGAANVESHTQGLVQYVDFTLPLHLPVTDWVISFEVGEHVPSKFEGMFLRNLHAHNCQGIVLSWATFAQRGGTSHINLHRNQHLEGIFDDLGYVLDKEWQEKFRNATTTSSFFRGSLMVFKRRHAVC